MVASHHGKPADFYKAFAATKTAHADYRNKTDKWEERYGEKAQKPEENLIYSIKDDIIKNKISERGFVYETICYVCIALAIAIVNNCYSQCYS
ncbi:MAG: hypothetical protein K1W13_03155 [Lachnospiraceae bacterium]